MKFRGLGTALVTPWRPDGAFDEGAFETFVDWQIEQGVNFLVPCGTTGENPAMTAGEHRRVVELAGKRSNGRVPVLAGAGSNKTERAIEPAPMAVDLRAHGAAAITAL